MKITIDMENLGGIIEEAVKENTKETISDYVDKKTKSMLESQYGKIIEEEVDKKMREYVSNYLETYELKVGGGFGEEEVKTYTPKQYINKLISETFEKKGFTVTERDSYYGGTKTKTVSFEDFIKKEMNVDGEIKSHMTALAKEVKQAVNISLKNDYNKALKEALSDVVYDAIMENEKFRNISNSIKRLS